MRATAIIGIAIALFVGAGLRLIWPADMEYKADEIYSFERTQRVGVSEPFPWTGMSNSADVPHPGMSVWVFLGLAKLADARDPVRLNIACMTLNVVALLALTVFIARVVSPAEREWWWWGLALAAVNPLEIVFHRKIWPPSVLPIVTVLLLTAWWYRHRKLGSFMFGVLAILAAQIHPGAFFFAGGMAIWALLFDRKSVRWCFGLLGAIIGSIPAWPWLYHLLFVAQRSAAAKSKWTHIAELKFWINWFTEPFGFSLQYSLGHDFGDFLRSPTIGGQPSYLVGALHVAMAVTFLAIAGRWIVRRPWSSASVQFNGERSPDNAQTTFTLAAVAIGYGGALTLTGLPVYRHYMIILFPLMFVWVARCAFLGYQPKYARAWLLTACIVQALVSFSFLHYIHTRTAPIRGDYGTPYRMYHKS